MTTDPTPSSNDVDAECMRGAELVNAGKLAEAAEVFRALCDNAKIAESIRALMAHNLATVYDKMGHTDTAMKTREYATSIVLTPFVFAEETRAAYLYEKGQVQRAAEVWRSLLGLKMLPSDVKARVEYNLAAAMKA